MSLTTADSPSVKGLPHLLEVGQLGREDVNEILARADHIKAHGPSQPKGARKAVASLFFQTSTRTRLGFQAAVGLLGHVHLDPGDIKGLRSLEGGGETLRDSIANISRIADLIVLRHDAEGIQREMTEYSKCPIVNAGDGMNEHPTQGMIDLYALKTKFGSLKGLRLASVGDPRARHLHSSLKLIALEGIAELVVCVDNEDHLQESLGAIMEEFRRGGTKVTVSTELEPALHCDAMTVHPIDISNVIKGAIGERVAESHEHDESRLNVTAERLRAANSKTIVIHPLPRHREICQSVDAMPNAYYFEQVKLSNYVRMALVERILEGTPWIGR